MLDKRSYSESPSHITIEHPHCPECRQARMRLARIAPGLAGFDIRTFECATCDHTLTAAVENTPKGRDPK